MHEALAATPIRIRVGLHSGAPLLTDEGYVGDAVHLAARIAAAGHGGQTILSEATRQLLPKGMETRSLGEHRLKDFPAALVLHQLGDGDFPPLRTLAPTNLPAPISSFVGRDAELAELEHWVASGSRLVTITAPGGMGKTRLGIAAARRLQPRFGAGTWWVDLAPIQDPSLVIPTIGAVIGATGDVARAIGQRSMLVVVDNLEQVLDAATELGALLAACPNLVLLATSRVRLGIPGERELALTALPLAEAVRLFEERAGQRGDPATSELCRRLDALPLAIELAASRARLLGAGAVLDRLGDRLDLLKGGRGTPERHQTLRATIAWSDELLDPASRALFRELSVFAGGWTLDAADAVLGADLDALGSLVEHSLVRRSGERFSMLETIRAYAAEGFADDPRRPPIEAAFCAWAIELLEAQDRLVRGPRQVAALAVLDAEIDNVRAGWEIARRSPEPDLARRYARAARWWLGRRGFFAESTAWARAAAETPGRDPGLQGWVLLDVASANSGIPGPDEVELFARIRALGLEAGDLNLVAATLEFEGSWVPGVDGRRMLEEARAIYAGLGLRDYLGRATINLAAHALNDGDDEDALAASDEAVELARELGNQHGLGVALGNRALALAFLGRLDEADRSAVAGLAALDAVGDVFGVIAIAEIAAVTSARRGELVAAARLLGSLDEGYRRVGLGREPSGERARALVDTALGGLDPATRTAEVAAGAAMEPREALAAWQAAGVSA